MKVVIKMYKLQISSEMKELHKKYFEDNTKSKIEEREKGEKAGNYKEWLNLVLCEWEKIAIGEFDDLKLLDAKLRPKYNLLTDDQKREVYKDFGYDNFKIKDLYDYYNSRAKKLINWENCSSNKVNQNKMYGTLISLLKKDFPEYEAVIFSEIEAPLAHVTQKSKFIRKKIEKVITKDITLHNFKAHRDLFNKEWNPYYFIFLSNVSICPYCNRQYINPIFSTTGKLRAQLDHFMPKSKYPYFSMSLYNLIPCCSSCNASLKGTREFEFDDLHPYRDEISEHLKFGIFSLKEGTIEVKPNNISEEQRVKKYADMFKLETVYNYNTDLVKKLIRIRNRYSDKEIHNLYIKNKDFFSSEKELKNILIGGCPLNNRYSTETMSKFRYDIMKELKLI